MGIWPTGKFVPNVQCSNRSVSFTGTNRKKMDFSILVNRVWRSISQLMRINSNYITRRGMQLMRIRSNYERRSITRKTKSNITPDKYNTTKLGVKPTKRSIYCRIFGAGCARHSTGNENLSRPWNSPVWNRVRIYWNIYTKRVPDSRVYRWANYTSIISYHVPHSTWCLLIINVSVSITQIYSYSHRPRIYRKMIPYRPVSTSNITWKNICLGGTHLSSPRRFYRYREF